ncbi:DUF6188 family protein [Kitasatospora sp. NPDC002227]|uniref:DUF6188 family protein n=1 Tax=Kitasatospora sp. NPDC002227 TaxID=3154773 RepID=UPI00332B7DA9
MPTAFTEREDHWVLGLHGLTVTRVSVDHCLGLTLDQDWLITVGTPAELLPPSGPARRLDPRTQDVAPALALFGSEVRSAVAAKSGTLRLEFTDGTVLTCPSDPGHEAWQVNGPHRQLVVPTQGGALALWYTDSSGA